MGIGAVAPESFPSLAISPTDTREGEDQGARRGLAGSDRAR